MSDITKIKVNGDPESSYQLYPRNEEFAKRAGGNTGSQSGGGETPDMIITIMSPSTSGAHNGNYEITEGSVDAVYAAFRDGRYPIVKVRYSYGEIGSHIFTREEYYASVGVYGESLGLSYLTCDAYSGGRLYLHYTTMLSDGTISYTTSYKATLTTT